MSDRKRADALHPVSIGNVELPNNLVLAPMAGVTDLPYRLICREMGAGLTVTEMVSAKAVLYRNRNTRELLATDAAEHPVSMQIFGSDPAAIAEAVRMLEEQPFDIIDINMGCPVPKIVNNGDGSALMRDPALAGRVIEAAVSATSKPVTVKMRAGFRDGERTAPELAHIAQESGAAAVAVHARAREQYYAGTADWSIIREVKERIHIPVFGNGDIRSGADAARMYIETGCDGFLIGRKARGNPWIFREIGTYLKTGVSPEPPSETEIRDMMLRHLDAMLRQKGAYTAVREMRKHCAWYTAGISGAAGFRREINTAADAASMREMIRRYFP